MKKETFAKAVFAIIVLIFAFTTPALAAWGEIEGDVRITSTLENSRVSSLVWTGTEYGVSWEEGPFGSTQIYFSRIDSFSNKIGADILITNDGVNANSPSLVWTGTEYGLSWDDSRDGSSGEIYFARLDGFGNKIGSDVRITNDTAESHRPSLVWNGIEYALCWDDSRSGGQGLEIYFTRVDSSGNKIGSDIMITNANHNQSNPSLVWTGTQYGVAWEDGRKTIWDIFFARLDSSGNKAGADIDVSQNTSADSTEPSIVWTGTEFGISWNTMWGRKRIYLSRFDMNGNAIGPIILIIDGGVGSDSPSLVWTETEYGVSWHDRRDGNDEIYFARIDASGSKIDEDIRITNNIASSYLPSLVWTGTEYGVSWHDVRDGNYEIYFARIGQLGSGPIPTLSEWGLIILAFILLVIITWSMRRQRGRLPGTGQALLQRD